MCMSRLVEIEARIEVIDDSNRLSIEGLWYQVRQDHSRSCSVLDTAHLQPPEREGSSNINNGFSVNGNHPDAE